MRSCRACLQEKVEEDFPKQAPNNGVHHVCKKCQYARTAANRRKRKEDPQLAAFDRARTAARQRKHKYNVTPLEYTKMLINCDGSCPICHQRGDLVIDHDHACCPGEKSCGGCVRGLICRKCNQALGLMADDSARLRAAADYVERYSSVPQDGSSVAASRS